MRFQLLALVAMESLAVYALPHHHRKCGNGKARTTTPEPAPKPTTTVTTGLPTSDFKGFPTAPVESLPTVTTYKTYSMSESAKEDLETTTIITTGLPTSDFPGFPTASVESLPTVTTYSTYSMSESGREAIETTITTGLPLDEFPSFTAVDPESIPVVTTYTTDSMSPSETPCPTSVTRVAHPVINAYSQATEISYKVKATEQCGNTDRLILPGMPWTVANSMYNGDRMVGKQCTSFNGILQGADDIKEVKWTSTTDIEFDEHTKDLCKGYTNIGVGVNLDNKLKDIASIPAYFKWDRKNTTEFRGSNVFDFITSPTPGDTSSKATSEFMLWIRNWGNQVPIGYSRGPVATFNLFGASWKLYEGKNPGSGVTVRSMLVDENFDGVFQGDLKQWLDAMVHKGYISDSDYVTVGNAGTEVFYGKAVMNAVVALDIKV
ncbi:glycoside hydrolase family 12 protein [Poronia punctata]|nr:glycoside hydrolase family 12 protein [Poronia punctata]